MEILFSNAGNNSWTTKYPGLHSSALIVKTVCSWRKRAVCLKKHDWTWLTAKRNTVTSFYTRHSLGGEHLFCCMKRWKCGSKLCSMVSVCCHCPLLYVHRPLLYVGGRATFTATDAVEQSLLNRLNRPPVPLCWKSLNEDSQNSNNLCQFQNK